MPIQIGNAAAHGQENIELSDYGIVKRSAFTREKDSAVENAAAAMERSFADRLYRGMVFDYGKKHAVTFSKGCLEALGDPKYALLMIHPKMKLLLLAEAEEDTGKSNQLKGCRVEKNEDGAWVLEGCSAFLSRLADLMGWHPGKGTQMLFAGEMVDGNMVFRLSDALMFTTGSADDLADYMIMNFGSAATA